MPEYEADFYGWAQEQAALLRAGRLHDADVANIAEEIESMGRSEKRELVNRLEVLLQHLLKWRFQVERRSWRVTIEDQRDRLHAHLDDNPSLRARMQEAIDQAYPRGRRAAELETELDLPQDNPWSAAEIMDEDFYPE